MAALAGTLLSPATFLMTPSFDRPCWLEVNLDALRRNFDALRRKLSRDTGVLAVVKANAYGHGLEAAAKVAIQGGAAYLGVSSLEEGVALRKARVRSPVLILGSLYPFHHFSVLIDKKLTPTVASLAAADALQAVAKARRKQLPVHLKIDSGFGRIGVSIGHALEFIRRVKEHKGLQIEGLYTHFASSDVDAAYTRQQTRDFTTVVDAVRAEGIQPRWVHMANSSAVIRFPETHATLVRPGIAFYGVAPYQGADKDIALEPALSWKARVVFLKIVPAGTSVSYARTWTARRSSRIATLAVGYADGYPRLLSNKGHVLIGGKRVPVVGRVTMDMTMVDVTDLPDCRVGDEAVIIGRQQEERIEAQELADAAQTNAYEILCRISARVPRIYIHGRNKTR